jgi:hypothetical protein
MPGLTPPENEPDLIPTLPALDAEIDRLERRLKVLRRLRRAVADAAGGKDGVQP